MKKLISVISALSITAGLFCTAASAEAGVLPEDGLLFRVEVGSGVVADSYDSVSLWQDQSGNGYDLVAPENVNSQPYVNYDESIKGEKIVCLEPMCSATAEGVNYSGDASFVIYFRDARANSGSTLFSSHSYTGERITTSGQIPFTIENSGDHSLSFKMATASGEDEVHDMNIPVDEDKFMGLYVTIDSGTKTVKVYNSVMGNHEAITGPCAEFSLSEAPYWESFAYSVKYYGARTEGIMADITESAIYNRVLSLDEINEVNKYLKQKYEFPTIESLKLKNEITEIKKGELVTPEIVGIGNLMGDISEIEITDAVLESSDPNVVVVAGRSLRAVNFGTAMITVTYGDTPPYTFMVTVPQVFISDAEIDEFAPGAVISCSRSVENFDAQRPLSMVMVTVLYKNNMLLDINFERADNVTDSHLFETSFTMPQDILGCSVHMILLDADSMVPMSECVIKE